MLEEQQCTASEFVSVGLAPPTRMKTVHGYNPKKVAKSLGSHIVSFICTARHILHLVLYLFSSE